MRTESSFGGGTSARTYRHPLVARASRFLRSLVGLADPKARRVVRWTPMAASLAAVLMAWDKGCSLATRLADARACMDLDFGGSEGVGTTYNGFVKALGRQATTVLPVLKEDLRQQVEDRLPCLSKTLGWLLLAVDGSKAELPRTVDCETVFGFADNGKVPHALVTAIVEVQTGLPWDWRIDDARGSEKTHLMQMEPSLPDNSLLLADSNFVGFPIWSQLHNHDRQFLIRVGGNVRLLTNLWPDAEIRYDCTTVYVWPKTRQKDAAPVELRLIKLGKGKKAMHLITNVMDTERLSDADAGRIYRRRWEVETFFRSLKRTLGCVKLLSKAGRRARIEFEWAMIAMTITTMMAIDAAAKRRIDPARLSPAHIIKTLRKSLLRAGETHPSAALATLARELVAVLKDEYARTKPKRSRYKPKTSDTPKNHVLLPPVIRPATHEEIDLAKQFLRPTAA